MLEVLDRPARFIVESLAKGASNGRFNASDSDGVHAVCALRTEFCPTASLSSCLPKVDLAIVPKCCRRGEVAP